MIASDIVRLVHEALDTYRPPLTGAETVGTPWSLNRIQEELRLLREALVLPSLRTLRVNQQPDEAAWLVAVSDNDVVFYSESRAEYGLGKLEADGAVTDWGIYGDLAGTFMAR
jgi:hypothetical protein